MPETISKISITMALRGNILETDLLRDLQGKYLEKADSADKLAMLDGVAVGFVDGDLIILK